MCTTCKCLNKERLGALEELLDKLDSNLPPKEFEALKTEIIELIEKMKGY